MNIVGIIPARWQSTRFPGKPLVNILGKSLLRRTYENALRCRSLDAIAIATDDMRIADHAQSFGAKVFMTPSSCPTGTHRAWRVAEEHFQEAEIIVNIQGDEPCLDPQVVDALVAKLIATPEAVLTTPVAPLKDLELVKKTNIVKCVFDSRGRALYFSRLPIPFSLQEGAVYHRHLGVYCFKRPFMEHYVALERTPLQEREDLEQLKVLENGFQIHVVVVEDQATGVDTPEDLKIIENILCQKENISL